MDNYKMSDVKIDFLTKHNRKLLIELICNEQTHMIVKDHTKYESDRYKELEALKIKLKICEEIICQILQCVVAKIAQ